MKKIDNDGLLLCRMQALLCEKSINRFECSSEIFFRRFFNSSIILLFDKTSILDDTLTIDNCLDMMENEYNELNYGTVKYSKEEMYWIGYIYRYISYTYEISSKQIYKLINPKELKGLYLPYHTLSCEQAIERIQEAKNISFTNDNFINKSYYILNRLYNERNLIIKKESNLNNIDCFDIENIKGDIYSIFDNMFDITLGYLLLCDNKLIDIYIIENMRNNGYATTAIFLLNNMYKKQEYKYFIINNYNNSPFINKIILKYNNIMLNNNEYKILIK